MSNETCTLPVCCFCMTRSYSDSCQEVTVSRLDDCRSARTIVGSLTWTLDWIMDWVLDQCLIPRPSAPRPIIRRGVARRVWGWDWHMFSEAKPDKSIARVSGRTSCRNFCSPIGLQKTQTLCCYKNIVNTSQNSAEVGIGLPQSLTHYGIHVQRYRTKRALRPDPRVPDSKITASH